MAMITTLISLSLAILLINRCVDCVDRGGGADLGWRGDVLLDKTR